jgi:Glycosyl transferases group 1
VSSKSSISISITGRQSLPEKLLAYGLDWHLRGSRAFDSLLIEPLAEFASIELRGWDGQAVPEPIEPGRPTIFCMFPPPAEALGVPGARIVWIPMWDHARIYNQEWWERLSPELRVVALSKPVADRARSAGLSTLELRYYLDPSVLPTVEWDRGRVACYWNRTGMISPEALERLCQTLSLGRLLFRDQLDPRVDPGMAYTLPDTLGSTEVIPIRPSSKEEYLDLTREANFFIAPRTAEGVGLTFLEAMARGGCVIGYDAPTMNEYIRDGENGLLFKSRFPRFHPAAFVRLLRRSPHAVNVDQPWKRFSRQDHRALGERARLDHIAGHRSWLESIPAYGRFILDW